MPIALAALVAALPAPPGLPAHAWYSFAVFLGVVAGLVLEPLPNAAVAVDRVRGELRDELALLGLPAAHAPWR